MPVYNVKLEFTRVVEVHDTIDALDEYDAVESVTQWHQDKYPKFEITHWTIEEFE